MQRSSLLTSVALALLAIAPAPAQLVFNEVHGFGNGSTPALQGDFIEIWNMSPTPVDIAGYTLAMWVGDTGAPTLKVIPSGMAGTVVPGNCFYLFEEGGTLGQPLSDPLLTCSPPGMRIGTSPWSSSSSMGAYLRDPTGTCIDYIYLRRGTTALPATPPNLPPGCTWTLGNIASSGTGNGHIQRLTNADTNSFADWGQDPTANIGTPGGLNTTGAASQTSLGPCVGGAPALYQVNQPGARLNANNVAACPTVKARLAGVTTPCAPFNFTANINSTLAGNLFDVFYHGGDAVPAGGGGLTLIDGQIVNLDIFNPSFTSLNGMFTPYPGGPIAIPLSFSTGFEAVAQMVVFDASTASGLRLSQAQEVDIVAYLGRLAGPTADDTPMNAVSLANALFCGNAPPSVAFYGRSYSSFNVNPNGRVMFGAAGSTDWDPTVAEFASQNPSFGVYCDFSVNVNPPSSHIDILVPAPNVIRVQWFNAPYFGNPTTSANFYIELDAVSGAVTMGGLNSLPFFPVTTGTSNSAIIGVSRGNDTGGMPLVLATDNGPTAFGIAPLTAGPMNNSDMVYAFGQPQGLSGGADMLVFIPNASGNYDWYGQ